ncbi:MAG: hypothetical protein AAF711_00065 [Planctomycetota bacterium]
MRQKLVNHAAHCLIAGLILCPALFVKTTDAQPADLEYQVAPAPLGTEYSASFKTESPGTLDVLFDGDISTFTRPVTNTASSPQSIYLRFANPLTNLVGIRTGKSDPYHNYYPKSAEFFADLNGDGVFDTAVGQTDNLGPAEKSQGDHLFSYTPPKVYALEFRVTGQSEKAQNRAFLMNELALIYADKKWGEIEVDSDRPVSPNGPRRRSGSDNTSFNTRLEAPTPVKLINPANAAVNFTTIRGREHGHSASTLSVDESAVMRFVYHNNSKQNYIEAVLTNPTTLHAFNKGVVLSIPIDASRAVDVHEVVVRVRDARQEIYQWRQGFISGQLGWQDVRVMLDPARHQGNWGGQDDQIGTIEEPVQLLSLGFVADREHGASHEVHVDVQHVARNIVDESELTSDMRLDAIKMSLEGPRDAKVLTTDDSDPFRVRLQNDGPFACTVIPAAKIVAYCGEAFDWIGQSVTLDPGEARDVDMRIDWPRLGWFEVELRIQDRESGASVDRKKLMVAYIKPVGTRGWRHGDDFGFGVCEALKDEVLAETAALMGVDFARGGAGWEELEPEPGRYTWEKMDSQAELARRYDISIQALTGFTPRWANRDGYFEKYKPTGWQSRGATIAPRIDSWKAFLRAAAARHSDVFTMWEVWNEPDLDAFFLGTTDDYLEIQRAAFEAIRSAAPDAMVGTGGFATVGSHGGHALNPDLMKRVLLEAYDYFDYIAHHEHGDFPSYQGMIDERLSPLTRQMPKQRPLYYTETAIDSDYTDDGRRLQAETLVKKYAFAHARGASGYLWFHMYRRYSEQDWGMLFHPRYQVRPILPAFTAMVDRLRNRSASGQLDTSAEDVWVLYFDDDISRSLVTWSESSTQGTQQLAVQVPESTDVSLWDMMGNAIEATTQDGVTIIDLSHEPMYVSAKTAPSTLRVMGPIVRVPASQYVIASQPFTVEAALVNPWKSPTTYELIWSLPSGATHQETITVPPGEEAKAILRASGIGSGDVPLVELSYTLLHRGVAGVVQQRLRTAKLLARGSAPHFVLDKEADVVEFNRFAPGREHLLWNGPQDLSARAFLRLEGDDIVLVFDVADDKLNPAESPAIMWQADSVQFAIASPGREGSWEIGIGRITDGSTSAYVWAMPSGVDDPTSLIDATSVVRDGGARYTLRVPIIALGLTPGQAVSGFSFSFVVNDNDGEGRESFVELTSGIGKEKDPSQYLAVRFDE